MPTRMSSIPENNFNHTPTSNGSNPSSRLPLLITQIGNKSTSRISKKKNYEDSSSLYDIDVTKVILYLHKILIKIYIIE